MKIWKSSGHLAPPLRPLWPDLPIRPTFRIRNVAMAFESTLSAADGPEVWLNASVTQFAIAPEISVAAPFHRHFSSVDRFLEGGYTACAVRRLALRDRV